MKVALMIRATQRGLRSDYLDTHAAADAQRIHQPSLLRHQAAQNEVGNEPRSLFNNIEVVLQQQRIDEGP